MFLLNTNVISDAIAARPNAGVRAWLASNDSAALHVSVITIGELHKGIAMARSRNAGRATLLAQWVTGIELHYAARILPVDLAIAQRWGLLMAADPSASAEDTLIAATALVHGFTVVTRNVRDFAPTGATVVNPFD